MAVIQVRNPELSEILRADFQSRWEPNFAWKSMASCLLGLPMLRGAWVTSVDSSGDWYDISGHGHHLGYNGNPTFNSVGLVGYWHYDGTGDYHNRTDEADLDISGTETYVASARRGLTMGGWFYPTETGTTEALMGKWGAAPQRSYRLYLDSTDQFNFRFSDDGTSVVTVTSAAVAMNAWYFVVGRAIPASSADLIVDWTEYNQATALTPIFDSNSDFCVGEISGTGQPFNGYAALCFLCAAALSSAQIRNLFQQTRAAFGV